MIYKERRRLTLPVTVHRKNDSTTIIDALLDSGAEVNIISPMAAKKLDWQPAGATSTIVRGIDGQTMISFGVYEEGIEVTDSWHQKRVTKCVFHSIASDEYAMVLGYPWLEAVDPQVSFKAKTWQYPRIR